MTDEHYNELKGKVDRAVEIKRVCDCSHQFRDRSKPGCKIFIKKPDHCWIAKKD